VRRNALLAPVLLHLGLHQESVGAGDPAHAYATFAVGRGEPVADRQAQ
jgi:hypothetical protein